jgi:hypothetical protein
VAEDRAAKYLRQWIVPRKPDDRRSFLGEDPIPHPYKLSIFVHRLMQYRAVDDAFRAFDLDPGEPKDWETLIIRLCTAHFGRALGPPRRWRHETLGQLAADFAKAKAKYPDMTAEDIRKHLAGKGRYRDVDPATIRRKMPAARKELAKAIAETKRCVELKLNSGLVARYPEDPHAIRRSLTPAQEQQIADWVTKKYNIMTDPGPWNLPMAEIEAALRPAI